MCQSHLNCQRKPVVKRIYLDYNATTPMDDVVIEAIEQVSRSLKGNPSSVHSEGQRARAVIERARRVIAGLVGSDKKEIVFTSGATESVNWVHQCLPHPGWIVTTRLEHPAVLQACHSAVDRGLAAGCLLLDNDEQGNIDLNQLRQELNSERSVSLVSVMLVNNEIGVRFPLEEIASLCRKAEVRCHTDATQAVGRIPLSFKELDVDLASFSAHKMYGPMGVGGLYVHNRVELEPFLSGGHQERAIRPGTENLIGIVGFGAAAVLAGDLEEEHERQQQLLQRLKQAVLQEIDKVVVNGESPSMAPNVLNVSFLGCDAEALSIACDLEGLSISAGSACSVGSVETSHVIRAITDDQERRRSAMRISLGRYTTEEEIDSCVAILARCVERLRES